MPSGRNTWHRDALPRDEMVNGFRIVQIIGRGGFGITYEAVDHIGQRFAIKECFPRGFAVRDGLDVVPSSPDEEAPFRDCRDRFLREALALKQLSDLRTATSGVVRVVTFFEAHGTAYLVMEYLGGRTLEGLIADNPSGLSPDQVCGLMRQVLEALTCVHDAGLLHRDVKPANIALREDGRPVLIDFGAVRGMNSGHTTVYTRVFTSGYAPIEQSSGLPQGPMSDLYAFGATFYRAIGGHPEDAFLRHQALQVGKPDPQRPARELGTGRYPAGVLTALDETMEVTPDKRPQSARDVLALLGESRTTIIVPPKPEPSPVPPKPEPPPPPRRQLWPWLAGAVGGAAALGLALLVGNGTIRFGPASQPVATNPPPLAATPPSSPPAVAPTPSPPPSQTPSVPTGPSTAQIDMEQQAYVQAHGNAAALRSYLNTYQVCVMRQAAQAEIQQLERLAQEDQTYRAAHGSVTALQSYVNTCQICASKVAAQTEIQQLQLAQQEQQEERIYEAAHGDITALRNYANSCQACAHRDDAQSEIARLRAATPIQGSGTYCGRPIDYTLDAGGAGGSGAALIGVWSGRWSGGPTCSVLIVERAPASGDAEIAYQYQVKSGYTGRFGVTGTIDYRGTLSFTDPDGGEFVFRISNDQSHLDAAFQRQSASLTGTFDKIR